MSKMTQIIIQYETFLNRNFTDTYDWVQQKIENMFAEDCKMNELIGNYLKMTPVLHEIPQKRMRLILLYFSTIFSKVYFDWILKIFEKFI